MTCLRHRYKRAGDERGAVQRHLSFVRAVDGGTAFIFVGGGTLDFIRKWYAVTRAKVI